MNSVLAFYIVHLCSFVGVLCVDSGSNYHDRFLN